MFFFQLLVNANETVKNEVALYSSDIFIPKSKPLVISFTLSLTIKLNFIDILSNSLYLLVRVFFPGNP